MNIITGRKFKPVIILSCCLFITITNCDRITFRKRSVLGSNLETRQNFTKQLIKSESNPSPPISAVSKPDSSHSNLQASKTNVENIAQNSSNNVTSKIPNGNSSVKVNSGANNNAISTTITPPKVSSNAALPSLNTGALWRGVSVFLGLSVIVIAYIIFRCARLSKNRTQMVRKYGILAHRQDVEMRPLPLDDEDEDDTTVFDASEVAVHDKQRRNI